MKAYYYHSESDSFFIAPLSYDREDKGIDDVFKVGLVYNKSVKELKKRLRKRGWNIFRVALLTKDLKDTDL